MIKKIISLKVVLIIIFVLAMTVGCNDKSMDNLEEQINVKNARITELERERRESFGINKKTEDQIKQDYYVMLDNSKFNIEDVYIYRYFGIYNGGVAVMMALYGVSLPPAIDEIMVVGLKFSFNTGRHIIMWKNGTFYSLQNAYDENFLTVDELEKIQDTHKAS